MSANKIAIHWPLIGNRQITDYLQKSIALRHLGGAYIFSGPEGIGKSTAADFFARALLCAGFESGGASLPCGTCPACTLLGAGGDHIFAAAHGNLSVIAPDPEKRDISIEQVRDLIKRLSLSSFGSGCKVGIIRQAERLNLNGANALLKTLEEPRPHTVIILLTSDIDALPQTIVSRSQVFHFRPVNTEEICDYLEKEKKAPRVLARRYARAALGRPALAAKLLEDDEYRESYRVLVETFLSFATGDINYRLDKLDAVLPPPAAGPAAARTAARALDAWEGLARDLLLSALALPDLVQHESILGELNSLIRRFDRRRIAGLFERIRHARRHLQANVSPRLVLENIAVNF